VRQTSTSSLSAALLKLPALLQTRSAASDQSLTSWLLPRKRLADESVATNLDGLGGGMVDADFHRIEISGDEIAGVSAPRSAASVSLHIFKKVLVSL